MSFDQSTIDEIKKYITDDNYDDEDLINNGYEEDDIAEARRQLAGGPASTTNDDDEGEEYLPSDDERKEGSSSESSSSSEDSDSDDENNNFDQLTPEQKRAKLKANEDEGLDPEADAEYDNDLAVDDGDLNAIVLEGMGKENRKKFDNETVKLNRDEIIRLQEELYASAPDIIKPILLMLMRNGISNEWIRRYDPATELTEVMNEAVLQDDKGNQVHRRLSYKDTRFTTSPMESETYDAAKEEDTNPYFKKDIALYGVDTPGHLMALITYVDKDGNNQALLFDSNGSGGSLRDALRNNGEIDLSNMIVIAGFAPHNEEFQSTLSQNIFISSMGRCASWALFNLMCFQPVLSMKKGEARDKAIRDITAFFEQFNGRGRMEHSRVMSSLIVALFTRLQLWGDDKDWFDQFNTSKQQAYFMPDFVKRSKKAKRMWLKMKVWKERVKQRTTSWLARDTPFTGPVYAKMFGFKTSDNSSSNRDVMEDVQKIARGGTVRLTSTLFRAQGTALYLQMPISQHFAPFDYESSYYYKRRDGTTELQGNERNGGKDGMVTLTFGVNHQEIQKKTRKALDQITWRDVLNHVRQQIAKNRSYWVELMELTNFDALTLFEYEDGDQTVKYGDFASNYEQRDDYDVEKYRKSGWERFEREDKNNYILHVRQETMWSKMTAALGSTYDNNNWPVLLDKPFPFHFYSKFAESSQEYYDKLNPKKEPRPLKNKIYLTFDHGTENRMNDLKTGVIFQRTEAFMNKLVVKGQSVNSYNNGLVGRTKSGVSTHQAASIMFKMTEEKEFEYKLKIGWLYATRNKLKNYYRYSKHEWYSTDDFDRKMTLRQHNGGMYGPLVLNNPANLRLTVVNADGKEPEWWEYLPERQSEMNQLKTLYCLKRAMNPQYERKMLTLSPDFYKEHVVYYPDWNEMQINWSENLYPWATQLFPVSFSDNYVLYPHNNKERIGERGNRIEVSSGGHLVDVTQHRNQESVRSMSGEANDGVVVGDMIRFKLNYCFEVRDYPPKQEGYLTEQRPVRIWAHLQVRGKIIRKEFEAMDQLPRANQDTYVRPPQWYYLIDVKKVDFVPNKYDVYKPNQDEFITRTDYRPYHVEIGKRRVRDGRLTFNKGRWYTHLQESVYKGPPRIDTHLGYLGNNYPLDESARKYLLTRFPDRIKVALRNDTLEKYSFPFQRLKKKKRKVVKDNNGNEFIDLTDGGSSSSVGKKRKKPGLVEALDFPKLKL